MEKRTLDESIAGDFVDGKPDAGIANDQLEGSPFVDPMRLDLFNEENELSPQNTSMLMGSLDTIMRRSVVISAIISEYGHAPAWAESKVYIAKDYVDGVADYMEAELFKSDRSMPEISKEAPVLSDTIKHRHIINGFVGLDFAEKSYKWSFSDEDQKEILGFIDVNDDMPDLERWSSCFMFVNKGGEDWLSAYKLPIAKMVNGALKVVFEAVVKAGEALRGDSIDDSFYDIIQATERDRVLMYKTISKMYRQFGEDAPEYRAIEKRAVGDLDPTNFPTKGEDEKVSLRNSSYPLFDLEYAKRLKDNYPEIWDLGGNVLGDKQFNRLVPIAENSGQVETNTQEEAVRLREAWIARHQQDFRIAGTIAQVKWLSIGDRGEKYMKDLIKDEIEKKELSLSEETTNEVKATESQTVEVRSNEEGIPDVEDVVEEVKKQVESDLLKRSEDPLSLKKVLVKEVEEKKSSMIKPQRLEKEQFEVRKMSIDKGETRYSLDGRGELKLAVGELSIRAVYSDGETADTPEERDRQGRPPKYYSIEGIASSTSVDHYGTEMTYEALLNMQAQFMAGVPILPRHQSLYGEGMAEWDEVIGRSMEAELRMINPDEMGNAYDYGDKQYLLNVKSRLYGDDPKARELVRRLDRGEPIGQSIGGWFNKMDVIENADGEIERIMVEDLTLDHLAITRAPANPDSYGLASIRSTIGDRLSSFRSEVGLGDTIEGAKSAIAQMPETMKRHIIKVVEYEDKIDICFGKSSEFMGIYKEGDEKPLEEAEEMIDEVVSSEEEKGQSNTVELRDAEELQHIDEKNEGKELPTDCVDPMSEAVEERAKIDNSENSQLLNRSNDDNNKQNNDESDLDNDVILDDDNSTGRSQSDFVSDNITQEDYIMRDEDFAKIAEMVRSAVQPIAERINKLEETPVSETRTVEPVKVQPVVEDNSVSFLKQELAETRAMLDQVMQQPVRMGRHLTTQVRGVGSKNAYSELISRSRQDGYTALSTIIEHNIDAIAGESSDDVTKRSQHDLVDLLAKGLRSAQLDGLLGTKAVTNWN